MPLHNYRDNACPWFIWDDDLPYVPRKIMNTTCLQLSMPQECLSETVGVTAWWQGQYLNASDHPPCALLMYIPPVLLVLVLQHLLLHLALFTLLLCIVLLTLLLCVVLLTLLTGDLIASLSASFKNCFRVSISLPGDTPFGRSSICGDRCDMRKPPSVSSSVLVGSFSKSSVVFAPV